MKPLAAVSAATLVLTLIPAPAAAGPGLADLIVTAGTAEGYRIATPTFTSESCAVLEGLISSPGDHRLLLFPTVTANIGTGDMRIGNPRRHPDWYTFAACHGHYHFDGFARYRLLDLDGVEAAEVFKAGFCMADMKIFDATLADRLRPRYKNCDHNQGLSSGWSDKYDIGLTGQWIEIDGVPAGDYLLEVTVNFTGQLPESDYSNNTRTFPVVIP